MQLDATSLPAIPVSPAALKFGIEMQTLATIISGGAYGAVIILFCSCFWVLRDPRRIPSRRMRPFLYLYITFMFSMSTMAFVQETVYTIKVIKGDIFPTGPNLLNYLTSLGEPVPLPFAIWGADGFMASMLWRCLVLYQGISPVRRILLVVALSLLALTSLGSGIAFFIVAAVYQSDSAKSLLPLVPDSLALPFQNTGQSRVSSVIMFCTTFINLSFTILISLRLLHYQKFINKTLGKEHGSPYTKVITICVESCALIVVFSTINIVMTVSDNTGYLIPFLLFPHVCIISPLLIVYRVAVGRSSKSDIGVSSAIADENLGQHRMNRSTGLRFQNTATTSLGRTENVEHDRSTSGHASETIEMTNRSST